MKKGISLLMAIIMLFAVVMIPMKAEAIGGMDVMAYYRVFDGDFYASAYPDVVAEVGNNYIALLTHFITKGSYEGRSGSKTFCPLLYKNKYPDLAGYGNNLSLYVRHYVDYGKAEGRFAIDSNVQSVDVVPGSCAGFVTQQISTCTTTYNARIARATNVELAAKSINGSIVMPGEEFSYSRTLMPRTTANGYVMATVYNNGQVEQGIGGGICQVSSTLYAAMRYCGLPATERHAHSLPVHYLPAGYDATISGTKVDLKFVNIYDVPLMIQAKAIDGNLTVNLLLIY